MAEFFDYDPTSGVKYETEMDDGKIVIAREQDVQPLLERNKAIANQGLADKGIKESWWHICDVPPVVWLELKRLGLDLFTKDDSEFKKVLQHIEKHYPYLKTTHKKIV